MSYTYKTETILDACSLKNSIKKYDFRNYTIIELLNQNILRHDL